MILLKKEIESYLEEIGYEGVSIARRENSLLFVGECGKTIYNVLETEVQKKLTIKEREYLTQKLKEIIKSSNFSAVIILNKSLFNLEERKKSFEDEYNFAREYSISSKGNSYKYSLSSSEKMILEGDSNNIIFRINTYLSENEIIEAISKMKKMIPKLKEYKLICERVKRISDEIRSKNECRI